MSIEEAKWTAVVMVISFRALGMSEFGTDEARKCRAGRKRRIGMAKGGPRF